MEHIEKYIYNIEDLDKCLQSKDEIVVYGAGDYGKRLIDYIIYIKKIDRVKGIVVTEKGKLNSEYKGIKIYEAASFLEEQKCVVLIAVSLPYQNDIADIVNRYGKIYRYITYEAYVNMGKRLDTKIRVPYKGIDFLLAGFTKCGTTSLHKALMGIKEIYLSEKKESLFFSWCDKVENPEEVLAQNYFDNIREGQLVGAIEPTFLREAERIHYFFGDKIKIIFLVRNPVKALFSAFKMQNRFGLERFEELYQKKGVYSSEMFDKYMDWLLDDGVCNMEYINWINQFWKYYPKEQVKIYFFEELISNPQMIINDLFSFLGISADYKHIELPLANEGNFVMADLESFRIAKLKRELSLKIMYSKLENKEWYDDQCRYLEICKQYDKANKIYNVKITEEQRKKAEEYFEPSVRRLETALHKELSELWF